MLYIQSNIICTTNNFIADAGKSSKQTECSDDYQSNFDDLKMTTNPAYGEIAKVLDDDNDQVNVCMATNPAYEQIELNAK